MEVDIKGLIRKLNAYCTSRLHAAAGLCVSRGNYEVTVEHVFLQLLDDPNADIQQILRHFEANPAPMIKSAQHVLDRLRSGNTGRPVFSPVLTQWIQDAWLLSSVDLGHHRVRSGGLFLALILRSDRYTDEDLAPYLEGIRRDELRRDFEQITAASHEGRDAGEAGGAEAAPGRTGDETAIGRFMVDFTARAKEGGIDPVFGRDREIRQMVDILARRRKNNPIVVGEAGVGKTAVVEGLALRIVEGDVPDVLRNVRLLGLDMGLLQAGAGVKGEFENRLKSVIAEVKASATPIVTFIDEAHTLIGAGGAVGSGDAANLLKPALARGELRTIAATTWSEYKKYFEKDPALARRFQLVQLDEPSEEATVLMLRGLRAKYEASHGVEILDSGIVAAARLSSRYISGRYLPDKAVDLLDTAAARVRVAKGSKPESLDDLERRIQALEREREALERDASHGTEPPKDRLEGLDAETESLKASLETVRARWDKEKEAVERVLELRKRISGDGSGNGGDGGENGAREDGLAPDPAALKADMTKALDEMRRIQGQEPLLPLEVDSRVVAGIVSNWTGIPVGKMQSGDAAQVLAFRERMGERIKGQDHALAAIDKGIRAARSGIQDPKIPIGVFLFVGPSGVGKTEAALTVADLMFGGERYMTTINMSEFQEKHTVSRLIGSPPGYVGYGEGGVLTEAVRQRPYSVVLLDEVEKADPEVLNIFYQVFDKGMLADGEGRVIDFKNTVIFLTSNLATDVITTMCSGPVTPEPEEVVKAIRPILSAHFKPALLARMEIVPFHILPPDILKEIVVLKLKKVGNRLEDSHKMKFQYGDDVVNLIANRCTEVETGARNIDHIIRQTLLPMLSTSLLEKMSEGPLPDTVRVAIDDSEQFSLEFTSTQNGV